METVSERRDLKDSKDFKKFHENFTWKKVFCPSLTSYTV